MFIKKYCQDTKRVLFTEPFEVWRYGPVVRSIYDEFKEYKGNAIKEYCAEVDGSILVVNERTSEAFKVAMDIIWNKYKTYDGIPLSEMTHKQGSAWWKAAKRGDSYLSINDILEEGPFIS